MAVPSSFFQNPVKIKMMSANESDVEVNIILSTLKLGSGHGEVLGKEHPAQKSGSLQVYRSLCVKRHGVFQQ